MDELLLVLRVLLALGAVAGVFWWWQRRNRRARGGELERPVRIIARQGLAAKAQLVIVEADGRRMMLGVTEHSVAVLRDDTAVLPDTAAKPRDEVAAPPTAEVLPAPADFTTVLGRARVQQEASDVAALADRPRDRHRLARAGRSSPIEGSILDAGTWRQAAAALRSGRAR